MDDVRMAYGRPKALDFEVNNQHYRLVVENIEGISYHYDGVGYGGETRRNVTGTASLYQIVTKTKPQPCRGLRKFLGLSPTRQVEEKQLIVKAGGSLVHCSSDGAVDRLLSEIRCSLVKLDEKGERFLPVPETGLWDIEVRGKINKFISDTGYAVYHELETRCEGGK